MEADLKKAIADALRQLSATDDSHWTKDGKPDLTATGGLAGHRLKREQVEAVAPGWGRKDREANLDPLPAETPKPKPEAKEPKEPKPKPGDEAERPAVTQPKPPGIGGVSRARKALEDSIPAEYRESVHVEHEGGKDFLVATKPVPVVTIGPIYWGERVGAERVYAKGERIAKYVGPLSKNVRLVPKTKPAEAVE